MNRLLLDTANKEEIRELVQTSAVAGVTTNPSLVAKEEKVEYSEMINQIATLVELSSPVPHRHLSVEVTTLDPEKMFTEATQLHQILLRFSQIDPFVKIPVMTRTLPLITRLKRYGVNVNATACMTAVQAKLAADAGAAVVSFFYNRMIDGLKKSNSADPRPEAMREIARFKKLSHVPVICGSIRVPSDVIECWEAGADYVTASMKVIDEITAHPKTIEAIVQFQKDIDAWQK